MEVLIIEDEPFAQSELKRLLIIANPAIEVKTCLESVEDAVEWFQTHEAPQLIFMDIQLSDGLSFEILNRIKIKAPVIFTTAYDEYAIQAFKLNSIDYLLKPIEQEALNSALLKHEELKNQFSSKPNFTAEQLENLINLTQQTREYKSRFIAKIGEQIKFIKTEHIAYFFAEDNEVFLTTFDKKRYIIEQTLEQLGVLLDPNYFFRINRSYFININSIAKVHRYFNSRLKIELDPPKEDEILISRIKVPEFLAWMEH